MRKLLYVLMFLTLACSCQREELEPATQGNGISNGEIEVSFSAIMPTVPVETKTMGGDLSVGIENLYLIVFDENGMLVETREAKLGTQVIDEGHPSEQAYSVTLTLTEKPRIIHFIANCPVDQVSYGHEASVIGNMYVENGQVAYWARVEMDELVLLTDANGNPVNDSNGNPLLTEMDKFKCVPMLRNYAQLTVTNNETSFQLEGFLIYNITHKGTIAPYNSYSNPVGFQSFINESGSRYNYPELYRLPYYGHVLTSTQLVTDVPQNVLTSTCDVDVYEWNDGVSTTKTVKGYGPIYLYERKISVKPGPESEWRESPSHLIIMGKFDSDNDGSFNDEKSTYYKVDLTRKIDGVSQYYNILRNFHYNFTIHDVHANGHSSIDAAVAGAPGNNLSGSVETSKFDNISDQIGRLLVSFITKTLVAGGDGVVLDFYYKYIPNLDHLETSANDLISATVKTGVKFENVIGGNVIDANEQNKDQNIIVSTKNETGGAWAGYRKVTFKIKEPGILAEEQIFTIKAVNGSDDNAEILSRDIRLILREPYDVRVECVQKKVNASVDEQVEVDILVPDDLTENLFPLDLNIEAEKRSLSPDLAENMLPVVSGPSVIPDKNGAPSFYYVKTIQTKADYDAITDTKVIGNKTYKVIKTHWVTNRADNESKVYVQNEYFNVGWDNFVNAKSLNGRFSEASLGVTNNETVDYLFEVASVDNSPVFTITLDRLMPTVLGDGLEQTNQEGVYTYTPTKAGQQTIHLKATEASEGKCTISITSDESFGYSDIMDEIYQTANITIPAGNLVTYFTNTNFNDSTSQYTVIYLYSVNPQNNNNATPISQYTYVRDKTNENPQQYRKAHNPEEILLPAGTTTVYLKYQHNNRNTYYKSFDASTASVSGVSIQLN